MPTAACGSSPEAAVVGGEDRPRTETPPVQSLAAEPTAAEHPGRGVPAEPARARCRSATDEGARAKLKRPRSGGIVDAVIRSAASRCDSGTKRD